ncbi:MAG: hypothetical protein AAFX81_12725 [Pseudomonadota bacterium]
MKIALVGAAFAALAFVAPVQAVAKAVQVIGGETRVALDFATLESAANLTLAGVTPAVNTDTGGNGVGFSINGPDVAPGARPSTFNYDPADPLNTLAGSIEHRGSVLFNEEAIIVGNFSITSAGGNRFEVADNVGLNIVLFDAIADLSTIVADNRSLFVAGDLAVSAAFADLLETAGLAGTNLAGATVGSFQVDAIVTPLPAGVALFGTAIALLGAARLRRRQT